LTDAVLPVLKAYGTPSFEKRVRAFIRRFGELERSYRKRRDLEKVKLRLPGNVAIQLSPGSHNALQVAVIEEFGPRFAPGAKVLYVGDTARKHVVRDAARLSKLRISITEHDKLPDIVFHDVAREWLFLVEAVTTHGPVSPKRHAEIHRMLHECPLGKVYVTAFLTKSDFRRYAADIAWETEVWIAESPDHMIHFNGPRFLGPYEQ
jgi:hypothetical protein